MRARCHRPCRCHVGANEPAGGSNFYYRGLCLSSSRLAAARAAAVFSVVLPPRWFLTYCPLLSLASPTVWYSHFQRRRPRRLSALDTGGRRQRTHTGRPSDRRSARPRPRHGSCGARVPPQHGTGSQPRIVTLAVPEDRARPMPPQHYCGRRRAHGRGTAPHQLCQEVARRCSAGAEPAFSLSSRVSSRLLGRECRCRESTRRRDERRRLISGEHPRDVAAARSRQHGRWPERGPRAHRARTVPAFCGAGQARHAAP